MRAPIALLAALALFAAPAAADVFTVRGVEVDETASTAARAREQAIAAGERLAAQHLIERLTLEEDRILVPALDNAIVERLVSGFQVEQEAVAGPRYIGRLTVTFDPAAVRNLLESYKVPYVLSSARPAVVVPLWQVSQDETRLWEGDNPWFEAWTIAGTADELVPVLAPSGDLEDISAIDAERARELDRAALQRLAAHYGSAKVLVALAWPVGADGEMSGRMVGIDFTRGGEATDYGTLGVGPPLDLARAAAGQLQQTWKRTMTVRDPSLSTKSVSVLFDSIDGWMRLQNVIAGEPLVQLARLDALTDDGALMTVEHRGRDDQLALVLREHGADISQAGGGWVIDQIASAATAPPAPTPAGGAAVGVPDAPQGAQSAPFVPQTAQPPIPADLRTAPAGPAGSQERP